MENITVIIPFFNGYQHIDATLADLSKFNLPVIIVDDHSDIPLTKNNIKIPVPLQKHIKIIRPEQKGWFTGACNAGILACNTDVLILNQDARLPGNKWLSMLAENRNTYAMIGEGIRGFHQAWPKGYIHGTFMFVRRDAINKVGMMNVTDFPLWGSTCEYQLRICRAGFKVLPLRSIPGFKHEHPGSRYGDSITEMLRRDPGNKEWYIRTPPLISVVVPCYNHGKYLPDLIASMIGGKTSLGDMPGQSLQAFELVIVNDGSTDDTAEILKDLVDPWKGIRSVTKNKASGTPAANNTGIRASFGACIAMLGADDMMEPIRLETMYRAWVKDKTRVVYDDVWLFKHGKRFFRFNMPEYNFDELIKKNHVHGAILFARDAWKKVGGYPENMTAGREDWAMNVKLGISGYCGHHIAEPMYLYRREGHNRTLRNTTPAMRQAFMNQMQAMYPEIYQGKYPMACCGKKSKTMPTKTSVKVISGAKSIPSSLTGSAGLTLLRYVGTNIGAMFYYGPVTGTAYKFGLSRPLGYVDNKDLATGKPRQPGLLEIRENDRQTFVREPAKIEQETVPENYAVPMALQKISAGSGEIPNPDQSQVIVEEQPIPDITAMTVKQIKEMLADTNLSDIADNLIEQERSAGNRKSVIALLEGIK